MGNRATPGTGIMAAHIAQSPHLGLTPSPSFGMSFNPDGREPIRGELFGIDHLETHARQLGQVCRRALRNIPAYPLLKQFERIDRALRLAYRQIAQAVPEQ